MKNYSNDIDAIEKLIKEVVYLPNNNDLLEFEIRGLETINEVKHIHDEYAQNRKAIEQSLQGFAKQLNEAITQ